MDLYLWTLVGSSLLGAGLLAGLGLRYRIDLIRCEAWPPLSHNLAAAGVYAVAVAVLSLAWLGWLRRCQSPTGPKTGTVLLGATAVYLVAALGPPALSDDPLFYAAIGRVLNESAGSAYQPLCQSLPADDPLLRSLIPHWRCGSSAYFSGFHAVAYAVAAVAKRDLSWHLRGYQAVAAVALLVSAWLTALALRGSSQRPAWGAALVALNPLSIVEGPASGHNDALLALAGAGFVLAYSRRHLGGAVLSQVLALSIKASALLLLLLLPAIAVLRWLRPAVDRLRQRRLSAGLLGLSALLLSGLLLWRWQPMVLFGPSHLPWEHCTRSIECLPRSILRGLLHRPQAAAYVGLGFRLLSGLWLLYVALRAAETPRLLLGWLGTGLFIYYLYLHPWSQSWYLLSLLPLAPWVPPRVGRALLCLSVSATAYYALVFIGNCLQDELLIAGIDLMEGLIVIVPPTVCLLRSPPKGVPGSPSVTARPRDALSSLFPPR